MKLIQASLTKRALIVGLLAGSGILAASSFAMTAGDADGKPGCEARHAHHAHAKGEEHAAKRMSELKEKLKLKPGQEAAWNTFANASQPGLRPAGGDRKAMRGEFEKLNTPQRLDKMLAMTDMRRAKLAERVQATKAFYAQLSPEQQGVFDAEAMPGRHRGHHPQVQS